MELCRLCLTEGSHQFSLFENDDQSLPTKIQTLLDIDVTEEREAYPQIICESCRINVLYFYTYRDKVRHNNKLLLKWNTKNLKLAKIGNDDEKHSENNLQTNQEGTVETVESEYLIYVKSEIDIEETNVIVGKNEIKQDEISIQQPNIPQAIIYPTNYTESRCKCKLCDFQAATEYDVKQHFDSCHKPEIVNKIPCKICGRILQKQCMSLHLKRHSKSQIFLTCKICRYSAPDFTDFLRHRRRKHSNEITKNILKLKCGDCHYVTNEMKEIRKHQAENHTVQLISDKFKVKVSSETGENLIKPEEATVDDEKNISDETAIGKEKRIFRCDKCDFKTTSRYVSQRHKFNKHQTPEQLKIHSCTQCSFQTAIRSQFKYHMNRKHITSEEKQVNCPICPKIISKFSLTGHLQKHSRFTEAIFKCQICTDFQTNKVIALREHFKTHHRNEETKNNIAMMCRHCNFETCDSKTLENHRMENHNLKRGPSVDDPLTCDICFKVLKNKQTLQAHKKQHERCDRICEICGRQFEFLGNYITHMHRHRGTHYKCPHCDFTIMDKKYLEKHIQIHLTKEQFKPMCCKFCKKRLANPKSLKNHIRNVHPFESVMSDL